MHINFNEKKLKEVILESKVVVALVNNLKSKQKVVIDLGCGDAKFLYRLAKDNPDNFYIGIDSSEKLLGPTVKKIRSKPQKGGLDNIKFVISSVENLDDALENLADILYINFPWGSLLEGLMRVDKSSIEKIVRLCKKDCEVSLFVTYDVKYEANFVHARNLPELSLNYLNGAWKTKLKKFKFKVKTVEQLTSEEKSNIHTSWGKELLAKRERDVYKVSAIVNKPKQPKRYIFRAYGHPNILARHKLTLELSKDKSLTQRGDCIIGINADFDKEKLKQFSGKITLKVCIDQLEQSFKCIVNPDFDSDHELVLRKSSFNSKRTFGFRLNHAANKLNREIVHKLQRKDAIMMVVIED